MLTLTYEYKLAPTSDQPQLFDDWLKISASVWNFALRERKDWVNSGIDVGLNSFVATSEGELIARPRFFMDASRKLKLLQRKLKHKKKGSSNWHKLNRRIALLHEHISNARKDWHFQVAQHLCNSAGTIFAEDLNLKGMSRGMLCKHTLDAAFGQFLSILSWTCWKRDIYFSKVDCRGTSQTCPVCDADVPKDLSVRQHLCPECQYQTDRDVASAQVVKKRGLRLITADGQSVLQNACGDGLTGAAMSSQESLRQENQGAIFGIPHYKRERFSGGRMSTTNLKPANKFRIS